MVVAVILAVLTTLRLGLVVVVVVLAGPRFIG